MKKLIKYIALITILATAIISCSSDVSKGMLRTIVESEAKVSYAIKKSSFNDTGDYFVSVEADGIYKTSYNSNYTNNVKREFYENSGTANIKSILDIYTDGNDSYILTVDVSGPINDPINTTTLKHFENNELYTEFNVVPQLSNVQGEVKALTENGYLISVKTDTDDEKSFIYIYKINPLNQSIIQINTDFSAKDFYNSDYNSTRYNSYSLVKDGSGVIEGIFISLTDSDSNLSSYTAGDAYYYVPTNGAPCIKINIIDNDNNNVNEPIVAATKIDNGEYILLTKDGDCYKTDMTVPVSVVTEIYNNKDNSDTFSNNLPTLNYTTPDDTSYLIAMNNNNHMLQYFSGTTTHGRINTLLDSNVAYANQLNNASDIIYIKYKGTGTYIDTTVVDSYWIATNNNGYYTIYIEADAVADASSIYHKSFEGFIEFDD